MATAKLDSFSIDIMKVPLTRNEYSGNNQNDKSRSRSNSNEFSKELCQVYNKGVTSRFNVDSKARSSNIQAWQNSTGLHNTQLYNTGTNNNTSDAHLYATGTSDNTRVAHMNNSSTSNVTFSNNITTKLVYTRVIKCGSSKMLELIRYSNLHNPFNLIHERAHSTIWYHTDHYLRGFTRTAKQWPEPWIFVKHMYFVDFIRYGHWTDMPAHFGLVREPLDRLISWYYYRYRQYNSKTISLDECVANTTGECVNIHYRDGRPHFSMISFFCGHDPVCRYPNSVSLKIAKSNVVKYYSVVGLSEDYQRFLEILEYMFPNYFLGVGVIYRTANEKEKFRNKNKKRQEVSEKTKTILRSQLGEEYEFYYFVRRRFHLLYAKIKPLL